MPADRRAPGLMQCIEPRRTPHGGSPETLQNWVTQAEVDGGSRPGATTDAERLSELEREVPVR
jgi:transposase-like protein